LKLPALLKLLFGGTYFGANTSFFSSELFSVSNFLKKIKTIKKKFERFFHLFGLENFQNQILGLDLDLFVALESFYR